MTIDTLVAVAPNIDPSKVTNGWTFAAYALALLIPLITLVLPSPLNRKKQ